MADGKNIEIRIAATGGEQAAAEVRKVETAADSLVGSTNGKGLKNLTEESTKVTAANVKMGTGMQNVGYQVQDLAVQIGSGTSAFRALGQQLPQLLSGFGPLGITLGTVAAVALPLAGAIFNLGDASAAAGEKADEAADKLKKLSDARSAKGVAEALKENKSFIESLNDEEDAIKRVNEALQRNIELQQAKRRAEAEISSAQAALDLAKIDANPNMSEADKIKARAGVQDSIERRKFEDRKAAAGDRVTAAESGASTVQDAASRKADDAEQARKRLAEQEAERVALKAKIDAAALAAGSLPGSEDLVSKAKLELAGARNQGEFGSSALRASPEQIAALQKKVADAEAARDQIQREAGGASGADRNKLATLEGKGGKGGTIDDTKKAIEDLDAAAKKLADDAVKARADAEKVRAVEEEGLRGGVEVYKRTSEARGITTDSAATKAEQAEAKKREDEKRRQESENRKQDTDEARRRRETTNEAKQGLGLADDITKAGGNSKQLKARAEAALKNPSQENQSALEQLLEQILTVVEQKTAPANGGKEFEKFKQRLQIVEAQIKNGRNGK